MTRPRTISPSVRLRIESSYISTSFWYSSSALRASSEAGSMLTIRSSSGIVPGASSEGVSASAVAAGGAAAAGAAASVSASAVTAGSPATGVAAASAAGVASGSCCFSSVETIVGNNLLALGFRRRSACGPPR